MFRHKIKVMRMADSNRVVAMRMRFCIGNKGITEIVEAGLGFEEMAIFGGGRIGQ
jgi:hypothetical protein